jgi:hypothetical protein
MGCSQAIFSPPTFKERQRVREVQGPHFSPASAASLPSPAYSGMSNAAPIYAVHKLEPYAFCARLHGFYARLRRLSANEAAEILLRKAG